MGTPTSYGGQSKLSRCRKKPKDFELQPDPLWGVVGLELRPRPFFQKFFEDVAERVFGDRGRWVDAAKYLGYVYADGDPRRFDYDPVELRVSLGLRPDLPLMKEGTEAAYRGVWDHFVMEDVDGQ